MGGRGRWGGVGVGGDRVGEGGGGRSIADHCVIEKKNWCMKYSAN